MLRNQCLDKFSQWSRKSEDNAWQEFSAAVVEAGMQMTIGELGKNLDKYLGYNMTHKDKECIWETFKQRPHLEDNPDTLDDRLVALQSLLQSRHHSRFQRVYQLLSLEQETEQ